MRLLLYLRTIRYLKPIQIYSRLRSLLRQPAVDHRPAPSPASASVRIVEPIKRAPAWDGGTRFRFLNEEHDIRCAQDWNNAQWPKLWLYHLHYLDDLNAEPSPQPPGACAALLDRWVHENPPGGGVGWEPYPCSLRIVNCIKWTLRGNQLSPHALQSLAVQTRWLQQSIEWHLLGNHLFANAKALVFAGMYFAGDEARQWLDRGLAIVSSQAAEQILEDGGHYERSPMYHAIIAEDLLDLVNLLRAYGQEPPVLWTAKLGVMRSWLAAMIHPDGDIALFNDAALDHAPDRRDIEAYAQALGLTAPRELPASLVHLRHSGYVRAARGPAVLLADLASVGPDFMPGHAHADTLTFELSLYGKRFIVNSGTSVYGLGPERDRQRGTGAHNTIVIDGQDSSEVWAGFRVARRARVFSVNAESGREIRVQGAHDGYRHLPGSPVHRREWHLNDRCLVIVDSIEGSGSHDVCATWHLAPELDAAQKAPCRYELLSAQTGLVLLSVDGDTACSLEPGTYHPRFGASLPNQRIVARYRGKIPVVFRTTLQWRNAEGTEPH